MLLGFLIFALVLGSSKEIEDVLKKIEYSGAADFRHVKYTLSINPLPAFPVGAPGISTIFIIIWIPGINFESKLKENFSLNFELNNVFLIFPFELEVGVREYLERRGIEGFYLYQGLGGMLTYFFNGKFEVIPNLVLTFGDKYISRKGFTLDRFIGLKLLYSFSDSVAILEFRQGRIVLLPILGLYLGYSW
jgi:hypothetical protein